MRDTLADFSLQEVGNTGGEPWTMFMFQRAARAAHLLKQLRWMIPGITYAEMPARKLPASGLGWQMETHARRAFGTKSR